MPSFNKYGSITETLISDAVLNDLLSTHAVPPADLVLLDGDFQSQDMYGSIVGSVRRGKFVLSDVPRIVGFGLWANIADGLVQIQDPDDSTSGLRLSFEIQSYNSLGVLVQAAVLPIPLILKASEFNAFYDTDYTLSTAALDYGLTGPPKTSLPAGHFRIHVSVAGMNMSMISIDPAYGTKQLIIRPMIVVEHTYPFSPQGF